MINQEKKLVSYLGIFGFRMAPDKGTNCLVVGCPNLRHPKGEVVMGGDTEKNDDQSVLKRQYPRTFHV